MVIIDELSSFKNPQAKRFKALKKVRPKINRIVGLTGTPAPNSLLDLWAPFRLIDNGQRLGKYITHYRDQYFTPGRRNGTVIYNWNLRDGADQAIYDNIADITLSMRTADYLQLPEATHQHITVQLPAKARKQIDTLKKTSSSTSTTTPSTPPTQQPSHSNSSNSLAAPSTTKPETTTSPSITKKSKHLQNSPTKPKATPCWFATGSNTNSNAYSTQYPAHAH